jgi:hypothetical protein
VLGRLGGLILISNTNDMYIQTHSGRNWTVKVNENGGELFNSKEFIFNNSWVVMHT